MRVRQAASAVLRHREGFIRPVPASTPGSTIALGDSLTLGHSFPALRVAARDSYFDVLGCMGAVAYVANRAYNGADSGWIADHAAADLLPVERVMVLAGTNDVLFRPDIDTVANLERIREAVEVVGARLIVGLLPPLDEHPAEVMGLNQRIAAWADGVTLVDFWTPLTDSAGRFRPGLTRDGIHPTPEAARLMSMSAVPVL